MFKVHQANRIALIHALHESVQPARAAFEDIWPEGPNEAAFEEALRLGSRFGLIVSFQPSLAALEAELHVAAAQHGKTIVVESVLAEGALAALQRGEPQEHDRFVAASAHRLSSIDAVILSQFWSSRARAAVQQICDQPALTTPHSAVVELRDRISQATE